MSLNIECGSLHAEAINGPNDLYLYFDGGFFVWNVNTGEPCGVWFNGDMFMLMKHKFPSASAAAGELNAWIQEQLAAA